MKRFGCLILFLAITCALASCVKMPKDANVRLTLAAPKYLEGLLDTVAVQFERDNNIPVKIRYVTTDSILLLAKFDPDVDLFIINNQNRHNKLAKDSLLNRNIYSCLFRLPFMMITRAAGPSCDKIEEWRDDRFRRIAIVDPSLKYEGKLAKRVLEKHHMWKSLQKKLIKARSSQHLLSFLETAEADGAMLFGFSLGDAKGLIADKHFKNELKGYLHFCGGVNPRSKFRKSAHALLDFFDSPLCDLYRINGVYRTTDD